MKSLLSLFLLLVLQVTCSGVSAEALRFQHAYDDGHNSVDLVDMNGSVVATRTFLIGEITSIFPGANFFLVYDTFGVNIFAAPVLENGDREIILQQRVDDNFGSLWYSPAADLFVYTNLHYKVGCAERSEGNCEKLLGVIANVSELNKFDDSCIWAPKVESAESLEVRLNVWCGADFYDFVVNLEGPRLEPALFVPQELNYSTQIYQIGDRAGVVREPLESSTDKVLAIVPYGGPYTSHRFAPKNAELALLSEGISTYAIPYLLPNELNENDLLGNDYVTANDRFKWLSDSIGSAIISSDYKQRGYKIAFVGISFGGTLALFNSKDLTTAADYIIAINPLLELCHVAKRAGERGLSANWLNYFFDGDAGCADGSEVIGFDCPAVPAHLYISLDDAVLPLPERWAKMLVEKCPSIRLGKISNGGHGPSVKVLRQLIDATRLQMTASLNITSVKIN